MPFDRHDVTFSRREREIMLLKYHGHTHGQLAIRYGCSETTIKRQIAVILAKFQQRNLHEILARIADSDILAGQHIATPKDQPHRRASKIIPLLLKGLNNKDIAVLMDLDTVTVRVYVHYLCRSYGASSLAQLRVMLYKEQTVLTLLMKGYSTIKIAAKLNIEVAQVHSFIYNTCHRYGLKTRRELVDVLQNKK